MNTYGEIKRAVLELLNQYSIAGETVPLSYNNQADTVGRIPNLINQAVMKLRTTVMPETRMCGLTDGQSMGDWTAYPLPSNFRSLKTGGVYRTEGGRPVRTNRYELAGQSLMVPAGEGWQVEYYAYPAQLPPDPAEGYVLEEPPDVVQAAVYYAAAALTMGEDEYVSASLLREYESRASAMAAPLTAEVHAVEDALGLACASVYGG